MSTEALAAATGPSKIDTETHWVEHECDFPHTQDFTGDVAVDVQVYGRETYGFYTCPQCGVSAEFYQSGEE